MGLRASGMVCLLFVADQFAGAMDIVHAFFLRAAIGTVSIAADLLHVCRHHELHFSSSPAIKAAAECLAVTIHESCCMQGLYFPADPCVEPFWASGEGPTSEHFHDACRM